MIPTLQIPTAERRRPTGSRSQLPDRIEAHLEEKLAALFAPAPTVAATANADALHRMRVASRRLRVGLRYFASLFPENELTQVQRQLRRVTKTLGQIRSLDVNVQLLRKTTRRLPASTSPLQHKLLTDLLAARDAQIGELRELMQALRTSHFEARIRTMILKPLPRDDKRLLDESQEVLNKLRRELRRRYKKCRNDKDVGPPFHKFRIAAKRYRYALETSETVFSLGSASRIRAVEDLQDRMGKCHDLEELVRALEDARRRWCKAEKTLAEPFATVLAFFKAEQDLAFGRYRKLLGEERLWLKKVKLRLPHD